MKKTLMAAVVGFAFGSTAIVSHASDHKKDEKEAKDKHDKHDKSEKHDDKKKDEHPKH